MCTSTLSMSHVVCAIAAELNNNEHTLDTTTLLQPFIPHKENLFTVSKMY